MSRLANFGPRCFSSIMLIIQKDSAPSSYRFLEIYQYLLYLNIPFIIICCFEIATFTKIEVGIACFL